jgi:two-component system, NtrC family, sensor kinase
MGITEEVRSQIFEPFFTTKPIGKSTGLGISMSYPIVTQKHNCSLYCNSILGQENSDARSLQKLVLRYPNGMG